MVPSIYLVRREPARNRQRFQALTATPTRFGSWAMVREWGRIGQPGTVRETGFENEDGVCLCRRHEVTRTTATGIPTLSR